MMQAHEANTSKNVNHVYDKDNIGSDLSMEKWKYTMILILFIISTC